MRKFKVEVELENEAFRPDPGPEVVRLLKGIIEKIERGEDEGGRLVDTNGNTCGRFRFILPH